MKHAKSDLLQGTLDLLILRTLASGDMHGWGISQRLQQISQDVLQVNQGSLYPALYRLEQQGWIESSWGDSENNRRAKFYALTQIGPQAAGGGNRELGADHRRRRARAAARVGAGRPRRRMSDCADDRGAHVVLTCGAFADSRPHRPAFEQTHGRGAAPPSRARDRGAGRRAA